MKRTEKSLWLIPLLALGSATLACTLFSSGSPSTPVSSNQPIETSVAATVKALNPLTTALPEQLAGQPTPAETSAPAEALSETSLPPTTTPTPLPKLLPAALYFIGPDRSGLDQVWRLMPQGNSIEPITQEPASVTDFAVSTEGQVAYVVNNRLILKRPGFTGTSVIADGGADDGSDAYRFTKTIAGLAWAPDGLTLAYGQNGLHLYHPATGADVLALQNDVLAQGNFMLPRALYRPDAWSPDGSRLAIGISYTEGGTMAIFDPATSAVIKLQKTNGDSASCCTLAWALDGKALLSAGMTYGVTSADLWRYTAVDGKGTELIPTVGKDGIHNYVDWPILAPDGKLYYFYNGLAAPANGPVLYQMVRSEPDGVSGRTVQQANPLLISEALWAPDASLALAVLLTPGDASSSGASHGPIAVLFADGRPMQQIIQDGHKLVWGP
jgi:hypothetical protein